MSKSDIETNLYTDLLAVYLHAMRNETVNITEVTTEFPHINTRYARELLATLSPDLLQPVEIEGQDEWVIVYNEAQADQEYTDLDAAYTHTFDLWWNKRTGQPAPTKTKPKAKAKPRSVAVNADPNRKCRCGCGEPVGAKSTYRPGHDARHAGATAQKMAATDSTSWDSLLGALPTPALRAKATAHATRLVAKKRVAKVKAGDRPGPAPMRPLDPIKVGRWEYPAREYNGKIERNTKRDGSGSWIKADV